MTPRWRRSLRTARRDLGDTVLALRSLGARSLVADRKVRWLIVVTGFRRDPASMIEREWGVPGLSAVESGVDVIRVLAPLWLEPARLLLAVRAIRVVPTAGPMLDAVEATSEVMVKDHPQPPIRDMNAEQIAGLGREEWEAVSVQPERDPGVVEALGDAVAAA